MESQGIDIAPDQAVGATGTAEARPAAAPAGETAGANDAVAAATDAPPPRAADGAATGHVHEDGPANDATEAASAEPPVEAVAESEEGQS